MKRVLLLFSVLMLFCVPAFAWNTYDDVIPQFTFTQIPVSSQGYEYYVIFEHFSLNNMSWVELVYFDDISYISCMDDNQFSDSVTGLLIYTNQDKPEDFTINTEIFRLNENSDVWSSPVITYDNDYDFYSSQFVYGFNFPVSYYLGDEVLAHPFQVPLKEVIRTSMMALLTRIMTVGSRVLPIGLGILAVLLGVGLIPRVIRYFCH